MTSYVKHISRHDLNFVKNCRILAKFDMYIHMDVLSDFMFSNQFQDGRHDGIIANFSKLSNLLDNLYKKSYWCAYSVYFV